MQTNAFLKLAAATAALTLVTGALSAAPQCDPDAPQVSSPAPAVRATNAAAPATGTAAEAAAMLARPVVGLPRINEPAPDFEAVTTDGIRKLTDYRGRWLILFSHPSDFTPVCTTEFIGFAKAYPRFQELNTDLLGLSIDSVYAHIAWKRTIQEKFGVEIPFPIIDDLSMRVASAYGMVHPGASNTSAVRATFVIDPQGILRAMIYYPMTNGRSVDEFVRLVEALQISDREHLATPEGWQPGQRLIVPPPATSAAADARMRAGYECEDWFFCTTEDPSAKAAPSARAAEASADGQHKAAFVDKLEPYQCGDVQRLHTFAGIFLASQPQPSDFEQAKMGGVKTVINQRHASENKEFDERKVVTALGLAYHNPAFNGVDELTDKILDETRALLRTVERPVLMHCSSANRAGAVWFAYRALDEGLAVDKALEEAKVVGLRSPDYERKVRDYIQRHASAKSGGK